MGGDVRLSHRNCPESMRRAGNGGVWQNEAQFQQASLVAGAQTLISSSPGGWRPRRA